VVVVVVVGGIGQAVSLTPPQGICKVALVWLRIPTRLLVSKQLVLGVIVTYLP
jgi:hypothetical protein